jgi:hypothetical protein
LLLGSFVYLIAHTGGAMKHKNENWNAIIVEREEIKSAPSTFINVITIVQSSASQPVVFQFASAA